ncbi:hypothetical protein ACFE04_027459 [Oxalis oulophora]
MRFVSDIAGVQDLGVLGRGKAIMVFEHMKDNKDVVSWNTMVTGYSQENAAFWVEGQMLLRSSPFFQLCVVIGALLHVKQTHCAINFVLNLNMNDPDDDLMSSSYGKTPTRHHKPTLTSPITSPSPPSPTLQSPSTSNQQELSLSNQNKNRHHSLIKTRAVLICDDDIEVDRSTIES